MSRFIYMLKKFKGKYFFAWFISFLLNCFQSLIVNLIFGYGFKLGLDAIMVQDDFHLSLAIILILLGGIYLIFVLPLIDYMMVNESIRYRYHLMNDLFQKYIRMKSDKIHSLKVIDFIYNDTKEASKIFEWDYVVLFQAIFSGVGAFIIMSFYTRKIPFYCLIIGICMFIFNVLGRRSNNQNIKKQRKIWTKILELTSDIIDNMKVIHVYSLKKMYRKKYSENINIYENVSNKTLNHQNNLNIMNSFFGDLLIYITIVISGCVLVSKNEITVGTVLLFLQLSGGITFFFESFGDYFVNCQRIYYAVDRIKAFNQHATKNTQNKINKSISSYKLEGENINYTYENQGKNVIKNLTFSWDSPFFTVIKGKNGSGKSTLSKILANIIKEYQGKILLDDIPIFDMDQKEYSFLVGYIPQDVKFFSGTLLENIELGFKDYSKEYLKELIDITKLNKLFNEDSFVDERGKNLSFGERQRIAFIRALIRSPKIVILDEFDANIELSLYFNIIRFLIKEKKSLIIIEHKNINYDAVCDLYLYGMHELELKEGI